MQLSSVQFSHSVLFNSLRPHGLQHATLPCPSPTLGACSNSCPLCRWCHPIISSSVVPFSSRLQSFSASGSFPMSQSFASGSQSIGVQCRRPSFDSWVRKICWRFLGFLCGSAGKESAYNVGDLGLIPGLGRSPREEKGYPLQYSGLKNSMDCIVHEVTKSERLCNWVTFTFTYQRPGAV